MEIKSATTQSFMYQLILILLDLDRDLTDILYTIYIISDILYTNH